MTMRTEFIFVEKMCFLEEFFEMFLKYLSKCVESFHAMLCVSSKWEIGFKGAWQVAPWRPPSELSLHRRLGRGGSSVFKHTGGLQLQVWPLLTACSALWQLLAASCLKKAAQGTEAVCRWHPLWAVFKGEAIQGGKPTASLPLEPRLWASDFHRLADPLGPPCAGQRLWLQTQLLTFSLGSPPLTWGCPTPAVLGG